MCGSEVFECVLVLGVLQPVWRPGAFDAGPFLQQSEILCQLWVTLRRQATKQREDAITFHITDLYFHCDRIHSPISLFTFPTVWPMESPPTQSGRHRQHSEKQSHQPLRSSSLPCRNLLPAGGQKKELCCVQMWLGKSTIIGITWASCSSFKKLNEKTKYTTSSFAFECLC